MRRNGIGHMQNKNLSSRRTLERNGRGVRGPARGKMGHGRGGRVKRGR
jgi:hypothetical protein